VYFGGRLSIRSFLLMAFFEYHAVMILFQHCNVFPAILTDPYDSHYIRKLVTVRFFCFLIDIPAKLVVDNQVFAIFKTACRTKSTVETRPLISSCCLYKYIRSGHASIHQPHSNCLRICDYLGYSISAQTKPSGIYELENEQHLSLLRHCMVVNERLLMHQLEHAPLA
jgi:hypothetical protein